MNYKQASKYSKSQTPTRHQLTSFFSIRVNRAANLQVQRGEPGQPAPVHLIVRALYLQPGHHRLPAGLRLREVGRASAPPLDQITLHVVQG